MIISPENRSEDVYYETYEEIRNHEEYSPQDLVDLYYPCRICFGILRNGEEKVCNRRESCKEYKKWEYLFDYLDELDDYEFAKMTEDYWE